MHRLALSLASTALALLGIEAVVRLRLRLAGAPYSAAVAHAELAQVRSRARDPLPMPGRGTVRNPRSPHTVHPYLGYDLRTTREQLGAELARSSTGDPRDFLVVILGGSVAGIFAELGTPRLGELLAAHAGLAGREIRFLQLGRGAFKQPQQLLFLGYVLALGLRPAAVLEIDGFNEAALSCSNFGKGLHPLHPSYDQWIPLVQAAGMRNDLLEAFLEVREAKQALVSWTAPLLDSPLLRSAALGTYLLARTRAREGDYGATQAGYLAVLEANLFEPALLGPTFEGDARAAVEASIASWRECSILMAAICRTKGIPYMQVLQPTLHDPGAKPMTAEEREKGRIRDDWRQGVEIGYPRMRASAEELRAAGVSFHDFSFLFAEERESLYYDACHFAERGNVLLAEAIAPALLELLAAGH